MIRKFIVVIGLAIAALALILQAQIAPIVSVYNNRAVTSPVVVKTTGGNLHGWLIYNPNASLCYLQVLNSTNATLGTTVEVLNVPVLATSTSNFATDLIPMTSGISLGATTSSHGSSTCGTGLVVNLFYN